jgi:hypothetical protein
MGPYGISLALGLTGLVVMAVLGFGHHGGGAGHGHGGGAHAGHAGGHGHGGQAHGGHHGSGHGAGHGHAGHEGSGVRLLGLLSPRVLFSFLVGAGGAGLLLRPLLVEPLVAAGALVGGYVFERFLVGPIWKFLFRFESRQAATLESAIMEEASAETDFDARGQGLIRLELDGQVVQLLGTLRPEDRELTRRIRRGDRLRIEEVDPARNRCTVSYAGEGPTGGELTS